MISQAYCMKMAHQFNLNQLRVFESVYRLGKMSLAAAELHLTQPGISQHIKGLELSLGLKLFDRIDHSLVPTSHGKELFVETERALLRMDNLLTRFKASSGKMIGTIRIGMPIHFGNTHVIPLLSGFTQLHPGVQFRLNYDFASVMNRELIKGHLDFAFVDEFRLDPKIVKEIVYTENLDLYISDKVEIKKKINKNLTVKQLESLPFVDYQEDAALLKRWFYHHFKAKKINIHLKATVMDVEGVTRMICNGMGAGILPKYIAERLKKEGVNLVKISGPERSLKNNISLAYVKDRTQLPAAIELLSVIREFKKSL